jgi:hypothetical protein
VKLGGTRRLGFAVATFAVAVLPSCGGDSGSGTPAGPVTTTAPAREFAPLARLDGDERWLPMSTDHFIAHAGVEWTGGPCGMERDLSQSGTGPSAGGPQMPPLDARRLGAGGYEMRPAGRDCVRLRPHVYRSDQLTRPYDGRDRPAGLAADEGFTLDIAGDAQARERRPDPSGQLNGVPAYYVRDKAQVAGRPGMRIAYWLLFGREQRGDEHGREGDWERVDVLIRHGRRPDVYRPVAVEYRQGARWLRLSWDDVERTGSGATHPVAYLAKDVHTPGPHGECDECIEWRTWRSLRNAPAQPWWGFGGGWGAYSNTDERSGPAGPSPH